LTPVGSADHFSVCLIATVVVVYYKSAFLQAILPVDVIERAEACPRFAALEKHILEG